jgi:hypothetical protein
MRLVVSAVTRKKIPNSKLQIPNKSQISIFNDRNRFGIWPLAMYFDKNGAAALKPET